jgi:hypothetical protein
MKKIPTLFKRIYEGHKIVGITPEITEGCEEAFLKGVATVKIDGSCCAVIDGKFYKRYDAKKGKPIPEGAIKCQEEPDPITGHFPCWVQVDAVNPADKWFREAARYMSGNYAYKLLDGTYEAIGKHFQGNPYGLDYDTLERHGIETVSDLERTFEGVHEWLRAHNVEGIVFWLDDKPVCKIKRSDFGLEWPVKEAVNNG